MSRKLTIKEFIEKAREVHGNKYDYSKVDYQNQNKKVIIICPIHGEFEQNAGSHLQGRGCPKCSKPSGKYSTEEFIQKAKEVHGEFYDYSKVDYFDSTTPVTIICPIHGEFKQKPAKHLQGHGCEKCNRKKSALKQSLTTENFVEKANLVHNFKYTYFKTKYVSTHKKVIITCPIHGDFEQTPASHLRGTGCPKCAIELGKTKLKSNTEEFINKSKQIHGDRYNYSKVNYINAYTPVIIICSKHGEFEQRPTNHLCGKGCPKCANNISLTTEQFIQKAQKVHSNKYDYSKVIYVNHNTPVTIICPEHGEFEQRAGNHLNGKGCPKCQLKSQTKLYEKLKESFPNKEILFEAGKEIISWLGLQRFDIYFPKYNIAVEYNGKQHYVPIEYFGGKLKFQSQLEYDELKREKCKENNCTLFEVKYDYTEEDYQKLVKNIQNIINTYDRSKEN